MYTIKTVCGKEEGYFLIITIKDYKKVNTMLSLVLWSYKGIRSFFSYKDIRISNNYLT